jgi:multidrug efflux pump subunit AcrA (membrane-fusion protein)
MKTQLRFLAGIVAPFFVRFQVRRGRDGAPRRPRTPAERRPYLQTNFGMLSAALVAALLVGCGSGLTLSAHAADSSAALADDPPPAATYKAGRGLQLSPAATQHIGLVTTEVGPRDLPGALGVAAIPESALVRTVRGDFVFVANGGWLLRTPVVVGAAGSGWLEVKDGLYEGDTVVAQGARALWLAEIQAVNGGVSCSDGH